MKLTIVGLGPGHPDDVTRRAWRILHEAPDLYLRTAVHPVVEALERDYHSFDYVYEQADDFETVYETIVAHVLELAQRPTGVVYAVPGHPLIGEQTVTGLIQAATMPVEIIDGLSFIEPTLTALQLDGMVGLQIHDAAEIAAMHHPPLNPDQAALVGQVYNRMVASDTKLTLMNQYPDEHPVVLIHAAGTAEAIREEMPLHQIDHSPHLAHLTSLFIPPLTHASSFERFQETIAHLRAPEGCPWDQEQTHLSLRPFLLEETYEVLEALDAQDMPALCEELGDLLLQVVLHSQVAIDEGHFTMADIVAGINAKIIRRHPHVWGDAVAHNTEDLSRIWEAQKQAEKNGKASLLDSVPNALPALAQAYKYQGKAAKVGFDWDTIEPVIAKIFEEIDEVKAETDLERLTDEIGDLLFAVVNWARWLKVEPETALRAANLRFRQRFTYIETHAERPLAEMSLAELDALWDEAKQKIRLEEAG